MSNDIWPGEDEIARQMTKDARGPVRHEWYCDFWEGWFTSAFTRYVKRKA